MRETTRKRTWRRPRLLLALALAALAMLAIVGCGGGSGGSETSAASTSASAGASGEGGQGGSGGFAEISEEERACLKEQGVELPEAGAGGAPPEGGEMPEGEPPRGGEMPSGGPPEGGGTPPGEGGPPGFGGEGGEAMEEAFEACGVEAPQMQGGGPGGGPDTNSAAYRKQVEEYAACVRENGYDLPEPDFSGEGPVFDESEVDRESAAFRKASEACSDLLSKPSGGAQGTPGSGA